TGAGCGGSKGSRGAVPGAALSGARRSGSAPTWAGGVGGDHGVAAAPVVVGHLHRVGQGVPDEGEPLAGEVVQVGPGQLLRHPGAEAARPAHRRPGVPEGAAELAGHLALQADHVVQRGLAVHLAAHALALVERGDEQAARVGGAGAQPLDDLDVPLAPDLAVALE
ncbi:MAG: hypothetical protein ACK559_27740, partial [bacterium]